MAENKASWIDYLNLGLTIAVGGIGLYIAVHIGESADRLSQNGLIIASATFLLDDSPARRQGGVQIVSWLEENEVNLPPWEENLVAQIAGQANSRAPTTAVPSPTPSPSASAASIATAPAPTASAPTAPAPTASAPTARAPQSLPTTEAPNQQVANQLFAVIAGRAPRLFIEISDPEQQSGAEMLRTAVGRITVSGQSVIVPRIENVRASPNQVELRYLKRADQAEATALAASLTRLLDSPVPVRDMSSSYETRTDVKPRTYELWFPHATAISVQ